MSNTPASSEEIDEFVPPDIIIGPREKFNDFAKALYYYRDMMDYNSRLFFIFAKNPPREYPLKIPKIRGALQPKIERPYAHIAMEKMQDDYGLVCTLLSTKNKELIHVDKYLLLENKHDSGLCPKVAELYRRKYIFGYSKTYDRNFHIVHVCIGYVMYYFDEIYKSDKPEFNRREHYKVKEKLLGFIREKGVIDRIEYARQSFAYYNTELPKLIKFINANLEMILADVGDPKLLRLLEEDREKDKYHFITRKEQLLRIKIKRKEELEAELQDINAEIKSLETEN